LITANDHHAREIAVGAMVGVAIVVPVPSALVTEGETVLLDIKFESPPSHAALGESSSLQGLLLMVTVTAHSQDYAIICAVHK